MIKSDFDVDKFKESMIAFSDSLSKVFKPAQQIELEHKEVVKINKNNHRSFINKKCR